MYWGYAPTARDVAWPRDRRARHPWLITGGAAVLLAVAAIGGFIGHAVGSGTQTAARSPRSGGTGNPAGSGQNSQGSGPSDAASIAARVARGLVDVNTTVDYGAAQAAGTGMVLTPDGEVLTNNHVIDGATRITVTDIGNGKTYRATVVGYSVTKDVAVLQLTGASGLQTVSTDSAPMPAGERVVGIGNAGGTGGTPSYSGGTVTATGQAITASDELTGTSERLTGMIETSADIQAGDSGGPLVNAAGQVIGMDTAGSQIFQFASGSGGTGFAIPIGAVTTITAQITRGSMTATVHIGQTAFLGVRVDQQSTGGLGSGGPVSAGGVQIAGVVSGSPAARSGLTPGDLITAVSGRRVRSQKALQAVMVNDVRPGEHVTIRYDDAAGHRHLANVVLASGPPA